MTNHHLLSFPVLLLTNFLFTLLGVIPQTFVIALLTALVVQLQWVPHTRLAPVTLIFEACSAPASRLFRLFRLFELVACPVVPAGLDRGFLDAELRLWFVGLELRLTTADHSAPVNISAAFDAVSNFLFAESSAAFNSDISAFRAVISLLSSVTTELLEDREHGMQQNVDEISEK